MAYSDLPWLRGGDFLRAIIAGSENASQRDRLRLASQSGGPRFRSGGGFGGGGFGPRAPRTVPEAEPTGPHIGGIPGSPVLIDEARTGQPEAPRLPFSLGGKQFVTNEAGNVVDYVAPPNLTTPFGGQQAGYFQLDPKTGKPNQIIPPTKTSATEQKYNVPVMLGPNGGVRTLPMTSAQLESKWEQLPEFGKTNTVSQLVRNLGRDQMAIGTNRPNEVVRMTKDGKSAVYDAATKQFLRYAD